MENANYSLLGSVRKIHGINGEVVISVPDDKLAEIFEEKELIYIEIDGGLVPFFISPDGIRTKNSSDFIVKFDDINNIEQAKELLNQTVYIDKTESSVDIRSQFASGFFEGFTIIDKTIGKIGEYIGIIEYPLNSVIEVAYKEKSILIPVNKEIILSFDQEKKIILVDLPDGLIELYI